MLIFGYTHPNYHLQSQSLSAHKLPAESYLDNLPGQIYLGSSVVNFNVPTNVVPQPGGGGQITSNPQRDSGMMTMGIDNGLQTQDSFGRWINDIIADSPVSADDMTLQSSITTSHQSYTSPSVAPNFSSVVEQIFYINDISPSSASSTEETKVCSALLFFLPIVYYLLHVDKL